MKKDTLDIFIEKANKIHSNKYNYSKTEYLNSRTKITITCPIHGDFYQLPSSHLRNRGCNLCGINKCQTHMLKSQNDFILQANKIHNNKYNYSKVIYTGTKNKICIICPQHGEFNQTPFNHLQGNECYECSHYSKGEFRIKKYLQDNNINFIKEKTFNDCLSENNNRLRFDFYIPNLNIIIEYDGIQHFIPVKRFGGIKGLEQNQLRDKIKNEYCKLNNIKLLRICYKDRKNIELILKQELINIYYTF